MAIWHAILLGFLEGLTEFLPVSSTGHILLAGNFLGFDSPGKTFEVLIQLGAILAILSVYFRKLLDIALGMFTDPRRRRFVIAILLAFMPAACFRHQPAPAPRYTVTNHNVLASADLGNVNCCTECHTAHSDSVSKKATVTVSQSCQICHQEKRVTSLE